MSTGIHYTKADIAELMEAFKLMDKDGSGLLTADEIAHGLATAKRPASEALVQSVIDRFDKNKDGKIDFKEFLQLLAIDG